jgi:hypothetical protein
LKRSELKAVVKECLLEILMEGVASPATRQQVKETVEQQPRRKALDYVLPSGQRRQVNNNKNVVETNLRQKATSKVVDSIVPNDPVMASIFEDTASTTLREQIAADSGRSVQVNDTGVDPVALFEGADNWASLAFGSPATNRGRA